MSLICPVCFWEDDAFVGNALHVFSDCNKMTLATGRANFAKIGACDSEMLQHVLPAQERERFERRPLDATDPRPPRESCLCCGFVTLPERGQGLTCPVCLWNDDERVGDALHVYSLFNRTTLAGARASFAAMGACRATALPRVLDAQERERFERRPLAPG